MIKGIIIGFLLLVGIMVFFRLGQLGQATRECAESSNPDWCVRQYWLE